MTSSSPLETIDSVAASSPVVSLYQVGHNGNHGFRTIGSTERYVFHIEVLL
jgi:hypothetical protein